MDAQKARERDVGPCNIRSGYSDTHIKSVLLKTRNFSKRLQRLGKKISFPGKRNERFCDKLTTRQKSNLPSEFISTDVYLQMGVGFKYILDGFFFWSHCTACRILVPRPGIETVPPAVEVWSPNHWTTREFPTWVV